MEKHNYGAEIVRAYLRSAEILGIEQYKGLAIAKLATQESGLEHLVLSDALGEGLMIKESNDVGKLYVKNKTGERVLGIAGEYVVGGKQNRALKRTVYLGPGFEGYVPVHCVEQGRWYFASRDRGHRAHELNVCDELLRIWPGPQIPREHVPISDPELLCDGGIVPGSIKYASSQQEVWLGVDSSLISHNIDSETSNIEDVFKEKRGVLDEYIEHFSVDEKQTGIIAVFSHDNKKFFALDLFSRHSDLGSYHNKLIESCAIEASISAKEINVDVTELEKFLQELVLCEFHEREAVDLGYELTTSRESRAEGSALLHCGQPVYLSFRIHELESKNRGGEKRYRTRIIRF